MSGVTHLRESRTQDKRAGGEVRQAGGLGPVFPPASPSSWEEPTAAQGPGDAGAAEPTSPQRPAGTPFTAAPEKMLPGTPEVKAKGSLSACSLLALLSHPSRGRLGAGATPQGLGLQGMSVMCQDSRQLFSAS